MNTKRRDYGMNLSQAEVVTSLDPDALYFVPLGGSGEIGMNANFYGHGEDWIMIDCGVMFSRHPDGVLMPDLSYFLEMMPHKLKGLVLTHAHEDHFGAVVHLWKQLQCPIYATPFTIYLLREKFKEARLSAPIIEVPLGGEIELGCFKIRFVSITHSIPESNLFVITTPKGVIVHTGDWKFDPEPLLGPTTDMEELKRIGDAGVLAMVCETTNVFESGYAGSEGSVRESFKEMIKDCTGAAIVACFASNAARVKMAYSVAREEGREVLLLGKSLLRVRDAAVATGYFSEDMEFLSQDRVKTLPRHKLMVICTGSQAESAATLTRMGYGEHPALSIGEGDTVFFSARAIPGNDTAINELVNRLMRMDVRVVYGPHVSGHGCAEELKLMFECIRPQISISVHGEDRHIRQGANMAETLGIPVSITPHNGDIYTLAPEVTYVGGVPTQRLFLDGRRLIPLYGEIMRQRHDLFVDGIILAVLTVSRASHKVLSRHVAVHGLWDSIREEERWTARLAQELSKVLPQEFEQHLVPSVQSEIIRALQGTCVRAFGKRPVVKVQIHWIHNRKTRSKDENRPRDQAPEAADSHVG